MTSLDTYGWSHLALIIVYFIMFVGSLWVGIKTRSTGSKFEKAVFHGFFTFASICKITSFILYILLTDKISKIDINGNVVYLLTTAPSFLFLSVYSIVLLKCFDVYQILVIHPTILDHNRKRMLIIFSVITVMFYLVLMVLFILDFKLFPEALASVNSPISEIQVIIQIIDASVYVLASIGFLFYMYHFYIEYYEEVKGKFTHDHQKKFFKRIIAIVLVTFVAFILRSPFVVLSIFFPLNIWWKDLLYYGLFECIPLSLLIYVWLITISYVDLNKTTMGDETSKIPENITYKTPLIRNKKEPYNI